MRVAPGSRSSPIDKQPRGPAHLASYGFKIAAQVDPLSRFDTFIGLLNKTGIGAWAFTPFRCRRIHTAVKAPAI
jgi:hypothetical protein